MLLPKKLVKTKYTSVSAILLSIMVTTSCATVSSQSENDVLQSRASVPQRTKTYDDLTSLPKPRGILRAAVYSFRDYTGQYKPQPSNALSTAVTQGADAILINALLSSKWFAPVERANLQNLLTERKILQSSLAENGSEEVTLPSVKPAEVMIEGSIVSYDSNTQTGGAGFGILGVSASTAYREDRVTISMRLIDIDDGLILHNIVSTKRIFSRKLDGGIFSFVDSDEILEAEVGFSVNEPQHIAVTEAIESGLINLIAEGVVAGTLQLADTEDVQSEVFDRFISENQREVFLKETRLAAAEQLKLRNHAEAVRKRMYNGLASLKKFRLAREQERTEKTRLAAIQNRKRNAKKKVENTLADNKKIHCINNNCTDKKSPTKTVKLSQQPVRLSSNEKLIADQSQAILRAQAETQIRATHQAHQAALYAHKLIIQREAQIREQNIKQNADNDEVSQSNQDAVQLHKSSTQPLKTGQAPLIQPPQLNQQTLKDGTAQR